MPDKELQALLAEITAKEKAGTPLTATELALKATAAGLTDPNQRKLVEDNARELLKERQKDQLKKKYKGAADADINKAESRLKKDAAAAGMSPEALESMQREDGSPDTFAQNKAANAGRVNQLNKTEAAYVGMSLPEYEALPEKARNQMKRDAYVAKSQSEVSDKMKKAGLTTPAELAAMPERWRPHAIEKNRAILAGGSKRPQGVVTKMVTADGKILLDRANKEDNDLTTRGMQDVVQERFRKANAHDWGADRDGVRKYQRVVENPDGTRSLQTEAGPSFYTDEDGVRHVSGMFTTPGTVGTGKQVAPPQRMTPSNAPMQIGKPGGLSVWDGPGGIKIDSADPMAFASNMETLTPRGLTVTDGAVNFDNRLPAPSSGLRVAAQQKGRAHPSQASKEGVTSRPSSDGSGAAVPVIGGYDAETPGAPLAAFSASPESLETKVGRLTNPTMAQARERSAKILQQNTTGSGLPMTTKARNDASRISGEDRLTAQARVDGRDARDMADSLTISQTGMADNIITRGSGLGTARLRSEYGPNLEAAKKRVAELRGADARATDRLTRPLTLANIR